MRIGYGATVLARGLSSGSVDGIGRVSASLMQALLRRPGIELTPFTYTAQAQASIPGAIAVGTYSPQAAASLLLSSGFPSMERVFEGQLDLVHATDHFIPRLRNTPVLATLMDAIPLVRPDWVAYRFKTIKNIMWRKSAQWADHVVTLSDWSKREIAQAFSLADDKISIVPPGVDASWHGPFDAETLARVRQAHQLPATYFLFIGTLQPRKNLECLLQAHALLPQEIRDNFPLLIAGHRGWADQKLTSRLHNTDERGVRWLNYVPQGDLPCVLHLASALLFPSLHEGFGLPILEAFAAATPVIAANATAIPEVAGDAAMLLPPNDIGQWREAMQAIALGKLPVDQMRARGRLRAQHFTWERSASSMVSLYQQLVR